jgi:nucleoside 2-deoxyribosyltransferase
MSFREETKPIREAFRTAMQESGYSVAVIDEKEHNNQIVPEIFYEIERSKFVVVDVTYPNYGAYYEAGYAQALGKQVIICCREAEFHDKSTRPHFDISQKSMVVWKDETDLVQRLKRRIEATVK